MVQKKIIQDWWREWIESLASFYKVSYSKMFKTAFPPGWIGKHRKVSHSSKKQIWIEIQKDLDLDKGKYNDREFLIINALKNKGNWQNELINSG